jgi:hypothetical protein
MAHQPRRGTCQGDFAATVKEILPIDECSNVTTSSSIRNISGILPVIGGGRILTDSRVAA